MAQSLNVAQLMSWCWPDPTGLVKTAQKQLDGSSPWGMACASQGTGLGRLFARQHGLIPARINVYRWSLSNGCVHASGEQNQRPLIASVTLGHFLLTQPNNARHREEWEAVSERLVPPVSPFTGVHARLILSVPVSSGPVLVPLAA
jgi:hypothetical protein